MIKTVLKLLFGTVLAKIAPILLGLIVAKQSSIDNYSYFVNFLLMSNVVINIAALGCTPQILALSGSIKQKIEQLTKIILVGIFLLVSSFLFLFYSFDFGLLKSNPLIEDSWSILVFQIFGMYVLFLTTSKLNNDGKSNTAALVWVVYSIFSLVFGALWLFSSSNLFYLISAMAGGTLLTSLFSSSIAFKGLPTTFPYPKSSDFDLKVLAKAISLSLFGFLIVGTFFILQSKLQENDAIQGAYFSFFYQLFSLSVFVPAIIGNILVPKMSSGKALGGGIYVIYLMIAIVVMFPLFLFYEFILEFYGFDSGYIKLHHICLFYFICIFANLNSYSTQVLVANKKILILVLSSFFWTLSVLIYNLVFDFNLLNVLGSLLFGYILSFMFLTSFVYKKCLL